MTNKFNLLIVLIASLLIANTPASAQHMNNFGQTIQIQTNLRSFIGKPSWLLIVRDVEHDQVIPYLYDFTTEDNFWLAFTYGKSYRITVSEMSFAPSGRKIRNFCGLESLGGILTRTTLAISIRGKLSPNPDTFTCHVLKYAEADFNIATPQ